MGNYKIKVNNEAESKEAQELFEQLGFTWAGDYPENGDWYSHLYAENSTCCYLSPYVWNGLGDKFQELTLPQLRDLVTQSKNEQGMISGADAKLAWANGEDVQILCAFDEFCTITTNLSLSIFDDPNNKFRLKPRTIKLELEIPAPFEPKVGEECWVLNEHMTYKDGYKLILAHKDDHNYNFGAWRTEEEIKQVVAALRQGFKL